MADIVAFNIHILRQWYRFVVHMHGYGIGLEEDTEFTPRLGHLMHGVILTIYNCCSFLPNAELHVSQKAPKIGHALQTHANTYILNVLFQYEHIAKFIAYSKELLFIYLFIYICEKYFYYLNKQVRLINGCAVSTEYRINQCEFKFSS